jgi:hypothetical protein
MGGLRRRWSHVSDAVRLSTHAYVALVAMDLGLRVLGYRRLLERIERRPATAAISARRLLRARRYAAWLERASRRHLVRARCLHRSLALHAWLRRKGLPSELRIGVRKEEGALRAHAWVVLGGQVVNDREEVVAAFAPLVGSGLEAAALPALRFAEMTR